MGHARAGTRRPLKPEFVILITQSMAVGCSGWIMSATMDLPTDAILALSFPADPVLPPSLGGSRLPRRPPTRISGTIGPGYRTPAQTAPIP
ncbi:MAG: hypothetical protein AVDCRST_MAG70-1064 [uncultured Thermomicrobiales bacterium]|uniref:Uncharacterized protein n=1 Tax=uncultured Thermomicrobiales bacterium TaxID=1645740 RepID=A0A6J4UN74_9BACT|nr:MAG: hypothetical protein AVDCRST_MAG70-1064 [uncultured Thermomicrobiales bacterium]